MNLLDMVRKENTENSSKEQLIQKAFLSSAETYWGNVSKVKVYPHRTSGRGTEYFLVMCETDKSGKIGKLLQEWFINKEGEPRPNPRRQMWLDISLVDEVAGELYE